MKCLLAVFKLKDKFGASLLVCWSLELTVLICCVFIETIMKVKLHIHA